MLAYYSTLGLILYFWFITAFLIPSGNYKRLLKAAIFIILVLFVGLRHEVGGDWNPYLYWYKSIELNGLDVSLSSIILTDFGYNLVNYISATLGLGIYGVNTMCALIFLWGIFRFLSIVENKPSDFYMGLSLLYPYLIMVVGMGYTRQSVAIGLGMASLSYVLEGKERKGFIVALASVFFHKTGVINLIISTLAMKKYKRTTSWFLVFSFVALLPFALKILNRFVAVYVSNPIVSYGGIFRSFFVFIPAILLLLFLKIGAFEMEDEDELWVKMSYISILFALMAMMNLTVGDRMLLYFYEIPVVFIQKLQSRMSLLMRPVISNALLYFIVLFMTVWMIYGVHASAWVPYKNVLTL